MDSARFLDSARDPYARRQASTMSLTGSLASGQAYYTVESLEGASSLPSLKPGFGPPAPLSSDRDVFLGLEARTRALLADREAVDARARLLAAEREALLRRSMPGAPASDRRAFADGLTDARSRLDGVLPLDARSRYSLDDLHGGDLRARALGLDVRSQDALRPGIDDRARLLAPLGVLARGAPEQRSEAVRARELAAVGMSSVAPLRPPTDYLHGRRDVPDTRALGLPSNSLPSRRDSTYKAGRTFPKTERLPRTNNKETPAPRRAPAEAARKQARDFTNAKAPPEKPKTKTPPEQSEGWCAVCKIDCFNVKNLTGHMGGKKHKAAVEGESGKPKEPTAEIKTVKVERKRASDAKAEALPTAKRPKPLGAALGNGTAVKAEAAKGKANEVKKEKAKVSVTKDGKGGLTCEVCNIFTTGQFNLDAHLKGKRHAARVKELADSQVAN